MVTAVIGPNDPILGNTGSTSGGQWVGNRVFVIRDITISKVVVRDPGVRASSNIPAIYADAAGVPTSLLADGPSNPINGGYNDLPLTSPLFVAAGTFIWIGTYTTNTWEYHRTTGSNSSRFSGAPGPTAGSISSYTSCATIFAEGDVADTNPFGEANSVNVMLAARFGAEFTENNQSNAYVVGIFPSEFVEDSNVDFMLPLDTGMDAEVSQFTTLAVARGRVDDNSVRAWTFTLDGHDFYVITLGTKSTLVYDLTTKSWSEWSSPDLPIWRAHKGINWVNMDTLTFVNAKSNVVAGDDQRGLLWTLDPDIGYDQLPTTGVESYFTRIVTGGVPGEMRTTTPVNAVYLTGSMARPQITGADILLETSDDNGTSWQSHGGITVEAGNYDQEWSWRSLGLIKAPGKLFRLTDYGGSVRFDNLEMR